MASSRTAIRRNLSIMLIVTFAIVLAASFSSFGATASGTGYVNARSGAYLRKSASTSSGKVTLLKNNTKITINKEVFVNKTHYTSKYKWLYVTVKGKKGYIRSDLVDGIKYSAVSGKTTSSLNYRKGAGASMPRKGTLSKGRSVNIYMTAKPKGSSTLWYKIKVNGSYCYVCSTWVTKNTSIFTDTGDDSSKPSPGGSESASTEDFEAYLKSQGFPEAYKTKLRELHKKYPKWVFIAKKTNIDWNTAVKKESANGVSLVESVQPIAWRATDSNSFKAGSPIKVYSSAGGSTSVGSVANKEKFTILDEVWKGTTRWIHIKTSSGTKGYISSSLSTLSYPDSISGTVKENGVNIRKGAGTSNAVIKSLGANTAVSIVLQAKDSNGTVWYKIKNGSGYAYICSTYVKVSSKVSKTEVIETVTLSDKYPVATATAAAEYRLYPNALFAKAGSIDKGEQASVLGKATDASGNEWLKVYKDGKAVYTLAKYFTVEGETAEMTLPVNIKGTSTEDLNYRSGAGTNATKLGTMSAGTSLTITDAVLSGTTVWYKTTYSQKTVYVCGDYVSLVGETAPDDAAPVVTKESKTTEVEAKVSSLQGSGSVQTGSYIPKDGSNWFNANSKAVAYYMDPRNFLNADRIYMFEDLSYHGEYQTKTVVNKILSGTKLATYGFTASMFKDAGAKYGMSPVALAARARQETGGGSIAISGYVYNGKTVYNPFNIGATSSSNPVMNGIRYAYDHGWYTKKDAVYGGANFIANGYINRGQNSLYFQRFNVANGSSSVATHQYMTNLLAPYSEAYSVKTTYSSYGITGEALTFVIPIYNNMPSSTSLPK